VLVGVVDGDLVDHDARLGGGVVERLQGHDDHVQAIVVTLPVVVGVLFGGDQTLSRHTIDEGGL
jgi:hypothetical protein